MKDNNKKSEVKNHIRFYLHPENSTESDIILMLFLNYSYQQKITRSKKNNLTIITSLPCLPTGRR